MFRLLTTISIILMLAGTVAYLRFFYLFVRDGGSGHVQSLVTASLLIILGVQLLIAAMFAASLARNRQLIEEVLYQQRKAALEPSPGGEFAGQLESETPELAAVGRGPRSNPTI
jgi:hypothetical protein